MGGLGQLWALVFLWPYGACLLSVCLSLAHAGEELYGEGATLGGYMAGLWGERRLEAPLDAGVLLLPLALGVLAWAGYVSGSREALAVLACWRWADCVLMHWLPSAWKRPNPGLLTSVPCAMEAALLTWWLLS